MRVDPIIDVEPSLAACGLNTPHDFLGLDGIVVNGHVHRNVSRVRIGDRVAYLKREHRVRRGSLSLHEAEIIQYLGSQGVPVPRVLAAGREGRQAFVLLEAVEAIELRTLTNVTPSLARVIGELVARMHRAGVHQPDLFAKHFLVDPITDRLTIIDWQQARRMSRVPERFRIASLAMLRATCSESILDGDAWREVLQSYRDHSGSAVGLSTLANRTESMAKRLRIDRKVRSQLASPGPIQELVRIQGETVCAIPEVAGELSHPEVIESLYDADRNGRMMRFQSGRVGRLQNSGYSAWTARWWPRLRRSAWRAPELIAARILFHLERHGVRGPKLLAYGQVESSATAFVLFEPVDAMSANGEQALALLDQLHRASIILGGVDHEHSPFGVDCGGNPVVRDVSRLRIVKRLSNARIERDRRLLRQMFGVTS